MVKGKYQLHPPPPGGLSWKCSIQTIGGPSGLNSLAMVFHTMGAYKLYHKGIQCVKVSEHKIPLTCDEVKLSSHLPRDRLVTRPSIRPTYELNCAHLLDNHTKYDI